MTPPFAPKERETLFGLCRALTGCAQHFRADVILHGVSRRMAELSVDRLAAYLCRVEEDANEYKEFLSLITIHTTSFFRELPHFDALEAKMRDWCGRGTESGRSPFIRLLSVGCSTGQEVVSMALVCESVRADFPTFNFEIVGIDIDPRSLETSRRGIYWLAPALRQIPARFHRWLERDVDVGGEGVARLPSHLAKRLSFKAANIVRPLPFQDATFHVAFCRNVLIYFEEDTCHRVVGEIRRVVTPEGLVLIGVNEAGALSAMEKGNARADPVVPSGPARQRQGPAVSKGNGGSSGAAVANPLPREVTTRRPELAVRLRPPRVAVVDDEPDVVEFLRDELMKEGFEVFAFTSPQEALASIPGCDIDILVTDEIMPRFRGLELHERLASRCKRPYSALLVSGIADVELSEKALRLGIADVFAKPFYIKSLLDRIRELASSVDRAVTSSDVSAPRTLGPAARGVLLIGASTGGPSVVEHILADWSGDFPVAVVVIQHLAADHMPQFEARLAAASGLRGLQVDPLGPAGFGEEGRPLLAGHLYTPRGTRHLAVKIDRGVPFCVPSTAPPRNGYRPSVDVTFESATSLCDAGVDVAAVLLSGMGNDGAAGMLALSQKGAATFAQSKETCAVFGMPGAAVSLGAAGQVGTPSEIRAALWARFSRKEWR